MDSVNKTMAIRHLLEEHTTFGEIIVVAQGATAILAVLVNAIIATSFLVQKVRRPTTQISPTGVLVLNLVVADIIVSVAIFFLSPQVSVYPRLCGLRLAVSYLGTIGSHMALINVVVDRYVAIAYPLQYRDWMTMTRSVWMVCTGWVIPIVVAVVTATVTANVWLVGTARCSDIYAHRTIFRYVWVPSHIIGNLCIVAIQGCVYLNLRRYDAGRAPSNNLYRKSSEKSARIFYRVITPTYIVMLSYDVVLMIFVMRVTPVIKCMNDVVLVLVQLTYLMNPLVYSCATANIRKPISDLYSDIKKWLILPRESAKASKSTQVATVTGTGSPSFC